MPKLRSFLAKRVANSADREDLVQDILLRIHRGVPSVADRTRINGWICQLARNAVIDYYRRNPRRPGLEPAEPRPAVEAIVISWLAPMVDQFPEPYREAVRLSEIEGLAQAEVAARLSISVSGAKSRTQRGRVKLRETLMSCCEFEFDRGGRIVSFKPRTSKACVFC